VTRRSDLYSLGVVLYTLITGRTPFEGEVLDLLHKHRFAQFDRPARLVPDLPYEFDEIICQLLHKDPAHRPADAGVLARQLDRFRRKLARKDASAPTGGPDTVRIGGEGGAAPGRTGPATLMSRLMRRELERQNRGGAVARFLNHPWVLLALLLVTVGLIAWAFWPLSPETMFRRGAALMASSNPEDWDQAWEQYLKPLDSQFPPDHPHRAELDEYRRRHDNLQAEHQAARAARHAGPMGEAQWFYQEGLRRRQRGDEAGARRVWQGLVGAFQGVPSEGPWVRLARKELDKAPAQAGGPERQWAPLREAVRRAHDLRAKGRGEDADVILRGLEELYGDDPAARAVLKELGPG
jgi:hypothetical protein